MARRARDLEYWQGALSGAQPLVLPTDRPRPTASDGSARCVHELDAELGDAVFAFSRDRRVSPLMTMLAAVGTVLGRFAAQDDVTIGTAALRRHGPASATAPPHPGAVAQSANKTNAQARGRQTVAEGAGKIVAQGIDTAVVQSNDRTGARRSEGGAGLSSVAVAA